MNLSARLRNKKGFTLIELLVVIGILAVLLAITLIAINPGRQFAQANNTKRASDVNTILNAINQYMADNAGAVPTAITTTDQEINSGGADICSILVPTYIAQLPTDPSLTSIVGCPASPDTYASGYNVVKTAEGRITVSAPSTEVPATSDISVTR